VLKFAGIDIPEAKKPDGLKPKKPPPKDSPTPPEKKIKDTADKKEQKKEL
jgi:hypothetical protein